MHRWWEGKRIQLLWKTVGSLLKRLKIELPCNLAILLLGVCPNELKAQCFFCLFGFFYVYSYLRERERAQARGGDGGGLTERETQNTNESTVLKKYLYSHVHSNIIHNSQQLGATQMFFKR